MLHSTQPSGNVDVGEARVDGAYPNQLGRIGTD
jgi:hypothetical protein